MALATEITGDGILISVDNNIRVWYKYWHAGFSTYKESQKVEVREWVALTKTIAQTVAETAGQSGLAAGAVASYTANEDTRTVASYKLTKTITYEASVTVTFTAYS